MLPTDSLYVLIFVSGLLGGFGHCIGMCGPVVAAYSLPLGGSAAPQEGMTGRLGAFMPHLLYTLGRVTTYSILGGIMGLTGSFSGVVRSIERIQNITLAAVGVLMVMMGLAAGGWLPFPTRLGRANLFTGSIAGIVRFISGIKTVGAYFPMGLVLGFLPCGLLYTALIAAAGAGAEAGSGAGGFLRGMSLLFLFGLGTSPALFLFGRLVSARAERLRNTLYKGAAIMLILAGSLFVYRALR
ncbi:MAG TPA: sulfite exporter TauE/SafE family protein [Thermodesulfovibrionales bacterium]|nr:sulfite exporter TauE/SafE family protein [Thermodesulfovibrionales bacterium]